MSGKLFVCLVVLVVLVCQSVVSAANIPACAAALQYWETYDRLASCLRSNPVNEDNKAAAISSLRLAIKNYAFVDIIKSPPNQQFTQPVDLTVNLDKVAATNYESDADLQEALANAFIPLHDAHTRYNKPKPYSASYFVQPFRFDSLVNDNKQRVFLRYSAVDMDMYETLYGTSLVPDSIDSVDGWEILAMDEQDPVDVFSNAIDVATTKDAGSRFNLAINGYGDDKGYFGWRPLVKFEIPKRKSVRYVLVPPASAAGRAQQVTLVVNWMGIYQDATPAIAEAVTTAMKSADLKSWYEEEDRIRSAIHEKIGVPLTMKMLKSTKYTSKAAASPVKVSSKTVPVADPSGVAYADYSDDVGILKVSTFGPPDMQNFRSRVEEAMHSFSSAGKDRKLIIDLRSNGGGDICLGYALHRYLFPTTTAHTNGHGPHAMARYDMIKSELFSELAAKGAAMLATSPQSQLACGQDPEIVGYFTPCSWFSASDDASKAVKGSNIMVSSGDWMQNSITRTRGGVKAEYSTLIHEGCEDEYYNWAPPGGGFSGLDPERVLLLSDGLCGSTCAVFSSSIQLTGLAKTAVIGGFMDDKQLFWSFPGGEVETIEFLVSSAEELGVTSPYVPKLLPDGATFRFAIREIYPWDTSYSLGASDNAGFVPLEFVYEPSDYRVYYNSIFTDNAAVFEQVVPLLEKDHSCPAKGYRSPVTGKCGTCPPGSLVNAIGDGCDCEYGVWDYNTQACEWDAAVHTVQVFSTVIQRQYLADDVDYPSHDALHIIAVACFSFIIGVASTVVFMYFAVVGTEECRTYTQIEPVQL